MPSDRASAGGSSAAASAALVFRPVGPVGDDLLRAVVARVSRDVAVPCRVGPAADVPARDVAGRDQLDADHLLTAIEDGAERTRTAVVGLAARDMGNVVFTHFFGRARLGGRAVLVSLARLRPEWYGLPRDDGTTVRRVAREVLHELGHTAGLHHCDDAACLMHLARTVEAIDLRGERFCETCAAAMPRGLLRR